HGLDEELLGLVDGHEARRASSDEYLLGAGGKPGGGRRRRVGIYHGGAPRAPPTRAARPAQGGRLGDTRRFAGPGRGTTRRRGAATLRTLWCRPPVPARRSVSPSEFAFLALGLVLGIAVGAAVAEVFRARPAPRREVRLTVSPNSIAPRGRSTLASEARESSHA